MTKQYKRLSAYVLVVMAAVATNPIKATERRVDYAPSYDINGWRVVCYGLSSNRASCQAQYAERAPFVDVDFRKSDLTVSVRQGCALNGRARRIRIVRRARGDREVYDQFAKLMNAAGEACPRGSFEAGFTGNATDVAVLLMSATSSR